ncbi:MULTISPECIES: uracil-DNA glycosylase family protein [Ochrobactrum]|uniref:Uracil-DNA glycosylase family protein n=1 Tax=Ochrobactrum quorumnocens TaxID=271865 RepID=A0A5N1JN59_9HYPH|nr:MULTISPECIES: uracil-DNA glycosylase family protein [Brucella/Ochrobactrum group]KAA9361426.1 uracil-DNA glycosylase family protein [[Ochrobactrum] quorumnocens]MBD7993211.1 uracil-DNA glycosylase family protein [Ochrobactrum gallinarum]MCV9908302.1 uracil-DNA glycosylase family protein [Brucella sp. HL-2]
MGIMENLDELRHSIRACRICRDTPQFLPPLPHEPNPVCIISDTARIAICGQAPGIRVHNSSLPFNDPSGDRLRQWLGTTREEFYDPARFAIVPMGFCFPGYDKQGGDLPPRRECRQTWHDRVFASMPQLEFILVVGQYALAYHLPEWRKTSLTETVQNWRSFMETPNSAGRTVLPLPHPSWRNSGWLKRNPWFDQEVVPLLRQKVRHLIDVRK